MPPSRDHRRCILERAAECDKSTSFLEIDFNVGEGIALALLQSFPTNPSLLNLEASNQHLGQVGQDEDQILAVDGDVQEIEARAKLQQMRDGNAAQSWPDVYFGSEECNQNIGEKGQLTGISRA